VDTTRKEGDRRLAVRCKKGPCGAVAEIGLKGQGMVREHYYVFNFNQRILVYV
jgi:hypothetical protein